MMASGTLSRYALLNRALVRPGILHFKHQWSSSLQDWHRTVDMCPCAGRKLLLNHKKWEITKNTFLIGMICLSIAFTNPCSPWRRPFCSIAFQKQKKSVMPSDTSSGCVQKTTCEGKGCQGIALVIFVEALMHGFMSDMHNRRTNFALSLQPCAIFYSRWVKGARKFSSSRKSDHH